MTRILVLLLFASTSCFVQAAMYKWVDEQGKTVYSQSPPPKGKAERIKPPPPPAIDPAVARQQLEARQQALADRREDRELASQKAQEDKAQLERDRQRCAAARRNLQNFQGPPNRIVRNANGEFQRYNEKERQAKIAEAQQAISESCH